MDKEELLLIDSLKERIDYLYANLKENEIKEYKNNYPFAHINFSNFISEDLLKKINKHFPSPEQIKWRSFQNNLEIKLASQTRNDIPEFILKVLDEFNSEIFLNYLGKLTGIENLLPDFSYLGGGLHSIPKGGKLGIHTDFGYHNLNDQTVYRRVNFLLYLNLDWKDEYGGHLELWDSNTKTSAKKVLPLAGNVVIFNTDSDSFHGHPLPLTCPEDRQRRSLALYYYTKEKPNKQINNDTIFI